jgi:hypothetical protein
MVLVVVRDSRDQGARGPVRKLAHFFEFSVGRVGQARPAHAIATNSPSMVSDVVLSPQKHNHVPV